MLKRRLCLASAPLVHGQSYWHLTAAAAVKLNLSEKQCGPLSETAKIRAYAILHFCCLGEKQRHRLSAAEISQHFPDFHRPGLPYGYYLDPQGLGRLGLIRVDAGHAGRWDRVIESVREDVSSHIRQESFRKLVNANRFEIALLTVMPQKAQRLAEALGSHPDSRRIPIQVVAIPKLLPIVTSMQRKEAT
jgi:hypothetical protein